MAVQQNKKSRAKRDMRRAHDGVLNPAITRSNQGYHLRHHVDAQGVYKGVAVIPTKESQQEDTQN